MAPDGDGADDDRDLDQAEAAGVARHPNAELVDWYSAATLVCVPSYNESFGLVAVEAQATGTPVFKRSSSAIIHQVRVAPMLMPMAPIRFESISLRDTR